MPDYFTSTAFFVLLGLLLIAVIVAIIYVRKNQALLRDIKANMPTAGKGSAPSAPVTPTPITGTSKIVPVATTSPAKARRTRILTGDAYYRVIRRAIKGGAKVTCTQDEIDILNSLGFISARGHELTESNIYTYRRDAKPDKLDKLRKVVFPPPTPTTTLVPPAPAAPVSATPIRPLHAGVPVLDKESAELIAALLLTLPAGVENKGVIQVLSAKDIRTKTGSTVSSTNIITLLADAHELVPFNEDAVAHLPIVLRAQVRELLSERGSAPLPIPSDTVPAGETPPSPSTPTVQANTSMPVAPTPRGHYLKPYHDEIIQACQGNRTRVDIAAEFSKRLGVTVTPSVISGYYFRAMADKDTTADHSSTLQQQMQLPEAEMPTTSPVPTTPAPVVPPVTLSPIATKHKAHLTSVLTKAYRTHKGALNIICREVNGLGIRTQDGLAFTPEDIRISLRELIGVIVP